MYAFFQPRISVAQEEADITEMIDKEYERNQQEERNYYEHYYKQMEEEYYTYCIPYNEDTMYLVGTDDEAPEYYRYWED